MMGKWVVIEELIYIENMSTPRTKMRTKANALSRSDPAPQPGARECRRSTRSGSPCAEQRIRVCTRPLIRQIASKEKEPPSFDEGRTESGHGRGHGRQSHGWHLFRQNSKSWIAPQGCPMALPTTESPEGNQSRSREGGRGEHRAQGFG